jgi:hypothetical protein
MRINNRSNILLLLLKPHYLTTLALKVINQRRQRLELLPTRLFHAMIQTLLISRRLKMHLQTSKTHIQFMA